VRRFEASHADDSGNNEVGFRVGGAGDGAGGAVDDFDAGNSGAFDAGSELGGELFRGERYDVRTPAEGLRKGFVKVASGGQRSDRVAVRELLDDGEGALAYGAGGTEDGESCDEVFEFSSSLKCLLPLS